MLKLSICLVDQIRENIRDSVANFLYCLSAFSRCRPSVFVDIPSRYPALNRLLNKSRLDHVKTFNVLSCVLPSALSNGTLSDPRTNIQ